VCALLDLVDNHEHDKGINSMHAEKPR